MDKLLNCPFCGGKAILKKVNGRWAVICVIGCAGTRIFNDKKEAITSWNTRFEQPNEPLTFDELRQMDGEPVWIHEITKEPIDGNYYGIVSLDYKYRGSTSSVILSVPTNDVALVAIAPFSDCFKNWCAYRHKPIQTGGEQSLK